MAMPAIANHYCPSGVLFDKAGTFAVLRINLKRNRYAAGLAFSAIEIFASHRLIAWDFYHRRDSSALGGALSELIYQKAEHTPPREIGAKPKAYAFERSLGIPPAEACRRAGGKVENGLATKWENSKPVRAWIAYYRSLGYTDEMMAAKRQRIEDELQLIGTANMDDFVTLVPTGALVLPALDLTRIQALPVAERRAAMAAVKTIRYTENGPTFEFHGKLEALAQLRDMHGFKAVTKTAFTDPSGERELTVTWKTSPADEGCNPVASQPQKKAAP
jgi:hypothetical protein